MCLPKVQCLPEKGNGLKGYVGMVLKDLLLRYVKTSPLNFHPHCCGTSKSVEKYFEKNKTIVLFQVSDHSGAGNIQIEPFEKGSKSITLLNKGDAEVNIGGWTLTNTSGDDESSYKFHRAIAIPAGGSCTVHSADSTEVVMRITSKPLMRVSALQRV